MESINTHFECLAKPTIPSARPLMSVAAETSSRYAFGNPSTDLVVDQLRPFGELRQASAVSYDSPSSVPDSSRDGVANVNRWSQSTTSSRESKGRAHLGGISRRLSLSEYGRPIFESTLKTTLPLRSAKRDLSSHGSSSVAAVQHKKKAHDSALTYNLASSESLSTSPDMIERNSDRTNAKTTSPSIDVPSSGVREVVHDYFGRDWDEREVYEPTNANSTAPFRLSMKQQDDRIGQASKSPRSESTPSVLGGQPQSATYHNENMKHQSHGGKGSTTSSKIRDRSMKQPSQKAMLSQALQKANTAVLLDNASNYEGAKESYSEACSLLRSVMARSSGIEDRRKLEAIRNTYNSRIRELTKLGPPPLQGGKALPARPGNHTGHEHGKGQEPGLSEFMTLGITGVTTRQVLPYDTPARLSTHRALVLGSSLSQQQGLASTSESVPSRRSVPQTEEDLLPSLLSMRKPRLSLSAGPQCLEPLPVRSEKSHSRMPSNESMSWLDTIDESDVSTTSSIQSRTSSPGTLAEHIRSASSGTEADFDAALNAAVEAAYDERPDAGEMRIRQSHADEVHDNDDDVLVRVRRNVEVAKERIRRAEREATLGPSNQRQTARNSQGDGKLQLMAESQGLTDDSEEEERMLEEMTRSLALGDSSHSAPKKSTLQHVPVLSAPIQTVQNPSFTLAKTPLERKMPNVTKSSPLPTDRVYRESKMRSKPPPIHGLPAIPTQKIAAPLTNLESRARDLPTLQNGQGARNRRLSGQNHKRLKIDTMVCADNSTFPVQMPPSAAEAPFNRDTQAHVVGLAGHLHHHHEVSSPVPSSGLPDTISLSTIDTVIPVDTERKAEDTQPNSPISALHSRVVLKNYSSPSLRTLNRNLSASADESSDRSAHTPVSAYFRANSVPMQTRLHVAAGSNDPATTVSRDVDPVTQGGFHLFGNDIETPKCLTTADERDLRSTVHFEPCPSEPLLRPFWMMRALYQTMANPRGGYLSNKLFVPQDVWRVKGVKLKSLEDKISNCDYLTAALQKVARVDTYDADAVLVEMQALEGVFEQVQMNLAKRLGGEVGVQGVNSLFRDGSGSLDGDTNATGSRMNQGTNKSSFSWRRLRSKNSALALTNAYSTRLSSNGDTEKEASVMWSVPMTSSTSTRFAPRELKHIHFTGPYAHYMAALARLFDAAQILGLLEEAASPSFTDDGADKLARDADDPGLKHADKTQVGLELSTRHAAEFFGFYICRFVLGDVALLLDKFLKRGSEWVVV